jgi:Cdc6-like AAA superfamily ATPase
MALKTDVYNWIKDRIENNIKTTRFDLNIVFHDVLATELSSILADLIEDGRIDLKNYEYMAVTR